MRAPREVTYKWLFYALSIVLLLFLRLFLIPSLTIWGVLPFLPPILLATIASLEDTRPAVIFGLVFGIFCDLAFNAPFPCLYTLAFTLSALLSTLLSQRLLQTGFLCAVIVSILTFFVVALLNAAVLLPTGRASLYAIFSLFTRETTVSLLFLLICYPLLSFLHRFFAL